MLDTGLGEWCKSWISSPLTYSACLPCVGSNLHKQNQHPSSLLSFSLWSITHQLPEGSFKNMNRISLPWKTLTVFPKPLAQSFSCPHHLLPRDPRCPACWDPCFLLQPITLTHGHSLSFPPTRCQSILCAPDVPSCWEMQAGSLPSRFKLKCHLLSKDFSKCPYSYRPPPTPFIILPVLFSWEHLPTSKIIFLMKTFPLSLSIKVPKAGTISVWSTSVFRVLNNE